MEIEEQDTEALHEGLVFGSVLGMVQSLAGEFQGRASVLGHLCREEYLVAQMMGELTHWDQPREGAGTVYPSVMYGWWKERVLQHHRRTVAGCVFRPVGDDWIGRVPDEQTLLQSEIGRLWQM